MFGIIAIVVFILLFTKVNTLSKEVDNIKKQLQDRPQMQSPQMKEAVVGNSSLQPKVVPKTQTSTPQRTDHANVFFTWLKENWLLKLGVLLILVGFGWFISYAFVHNWIGPVGRVTLGFVTGAILALFGAIRMPKDSTQGKLFLVLGSALVVITSYASRVVYDFFDPVVSLGIVFLVSIYISTMALQFKTKNLAIYGLVIAFLSPLLTHSTIDVRLLFTYLIVVSLASIWLASIRGWRFINAITILGFGLYAFPYSSNLISLNLLDEMFVLSSTFGLALVYFLVSIIGAIKNQESADQSDIVVAIFDSALIILATIQFVPDELQSLVIASWMIVFAIGSFVAFSYTKKEKFFYVYSLISIMMLIIATTIELEGPTLIYAYAFESAIISIAGYIITRKLQVGYNLSALMIGPILMSLPSLTSRKWSEGIFHDDFGIILVTGIISVGLGMFYYFSDQEAEKYGDSFKEKYYVALNIIGTFFLLALIWLSSGAIFETSDSAILASLVIYTIIGIITYFHGLIRNKKVFKYYGATLLLLVVGRLVIIDVWDMELAKRIVTFIMIGLLFISTAFIGKKVKEDEVNEIKGQTPGDSINQLKS